MAEEEKTETGEETPEEAAPKAEAAPEAKDEAPEESPAEAEDTAEAPAAAEPAPELPTFTAKEIDKMNVPKLKEAALQYSGKISGVHGMDKGQLVRSLKEINDIPLQEAKRASKIDRQAVKQRIKGYKKERDNAIENKDPVKLKRTRNRTKALRRKLARNA